MKPCEHISTSLPALEDSVLLQKPAALKQSSFASVTQPGSETSRTTGPESLLSATSTTLTPLSVELWPTAAANKHSGTTREDFSKSLPEVAGFHCLPQASRVSRPLPPASEKAVQMTVGSGLRLSEWLNDSSLTCAYLKTLLASPRWRSPLRSLTWTLRGYAGCPDEPSAKSSRDLTFWDMTSRETGMASLGFRLCRLSVSALSKAGTECGSSPVEELWGAARASDAKGCGTTGSESFQHHLAKGYLDAQAQSHTELWATARSNSGTGAAEHGEGSADLQTQAASFQTGPIGYSKPGPTKSRGQLNPDFVCSLMGYPDGWLNYADSVTPLCRKSRKKSSPQS